MKPLKLELQAFGPYVSKQTVDFEKLWEKGMFLIKGATGSGKTTIFDAMMFALYGGGSGENDKSKVGRNDLEEWRCTQADPNAETFVSFTFSVRDRKYYFTRRLVPKRINLSARYEAGEIDENGNTVPFFANPKKDDLTKKAEELIGLNKEQFRQVVLLPQGQFERFLTAPSSEKEEILQKIFGSERWLGYVQAFFNEANERKNALDTEKREITASLNEDGLDSISALEEMIASLEEEKETITKEHILFDGKSRQKALTEDQRLVERFKPLHEYEHRYAGLINQKEEFAGKRSRYEAAEKAERVRGFIEEYEKAAATLSTRTERLTELETQLETAESKELTARNRVDEAEKASPVEKLTQQIGACEGKRTAYANVKAFSEICAEANALWEKAKHAFKTADELLVKAVRDAADKKIAYDISDETARNYRNRYFSGIYGEIAAGLEEGCKCPVCGSVTHPEPAEKQPDSVSKTDVDRMETEAANRKKEWDAAENARMAADRNKEEKNKTLNVAAAEREKAGANLNAAKEGLIEGIADEAALTKKIEMLQKQISDYKAGLKLLQDTYDEAHRTLTTLNANIDSAGKEKEEAQKDFDAKRLRLDRELEKEGYPGVQDAKGDLMENAERTELSSKIAVYETACKEALQSLEKVRQELKDQKEPDSSRFEERQKEISDESESFTKKDAELMTRIDRLSKKLQKLSEKQKHYDANILRSENDLAFARKLRGDTGIGLQRYVLAIMFNQVIGEANRMLAQVHGGRYSLFRSDDKGAGNKRGLELKVHDNRSPEKEGRGVGMLSGGEKFLVSLALSIGMSAVAQRSGVRIEALFIDEGFGTLDDSSIHDALNVLDSVRKGNGMIGIISHVQLLEANIPTHLEVVKSEKGSTISPG